MVDNEIDEPEPDMINFVTQDGIVETAVKERVDFLYTKWANPIGPGVLMEHTGWANPSGPGVLMNHTGWANPDGPGVLMNHTGWTNPNIPMAGRVDGPNVPRADREW